MIANPSKFQAITIGSKDKCINEFEIDQEFAIKIEKNVTLLEGQITPRKSRTPFVKILLFYLKILENPSVLGKISYAICKSELPLDFAWFSDR